jgi:hypothetical protein
MTMAVAVTAGEFLSEHENQKAQQQHEGDNHCALKSDMGVESFVSIGAVLSGVAVCMSFNGSVLVEVAVVAAVVMLPLVVLVITKQAKAVIVGLMLMMVVFVMIMLVMDFTHFAMLVMTVRMAVRRNQMGQGMQEYITKKTSRCKAQHDVMEVDCVFAPLCDQNTRWN